MPWPVRRRRHARRAGPGVSPRRPPSVRWPAGPSGRSRSAIPPGPSSRAARWPPSDASMPTSIITTRPPKRGRIFPSPVGVWPITTAFTPMDWSTFSTSGSKAASSPCARPRYDSGPFSPVASAARGFALVWARSVLSSLRTFRLISSQPSAATSGVSPPCRKATPLTVATTSRPRSHCPYAPLAERACARSTKPGGVWSRIFCR